MRYIFQYPDVTGLDGDMLDPGPVAALAIAAERSGWSGFAFTEHPAPSARWLANGGHQSLDLFVALGHVAAVTSTLTLLTYISVLPYRNPAMLAKTAATVDKLSNGRFVLGVGTGYLKAEYFALGVDFEARNDLFDEALDVLPLHWSGEPFDYAGSSFDCRGTIGRPTPVQQPIPIWIGGNATRTLRRVAERAQGWMPLTGPAELFPTTRSPQISTIVELRARLAMLREFAGARFEQLDICVAYTDHSIHSMRDMDRHHNALGELRDAGATCIALAGPAEPHPAACEFVEAFGREIIGSDAT